MLFIKINYYVLHMFHIVGVINNSWTKIFIYIFNAIDLYNIDTFITRTGHK